MAEIVLNKQQDTLDAVASLVQENARLRALLLATTNVAGPEITGAPAPVHLRAEMSTARSPADSSSSTIDEECEPIVLVAELKAAQLAQADLAREVAALRASQRALVSSAIENQSSELYHLRSSLAKLASELETEKTRANDVEARLRDEQDKFNMLRTKTDEQRRMLLSLQAAREGARRPSTESLGPPLSSSPRRSSFLDTAPRRKSSLGLVPPTSANALLAPTNPGLGLAVDSPQAGVPLSPNTNKPIALQRIAHRRGSASVSVLPEAGSPAEDDRLARLRELRLGVTSTHIASRRPSLVSGMPDFLALNDFDFDPERRRMSGLSFRGRNGSIAEDELRCPPSAPLRAAGRNNSLAMFESWSRRSSTDLSYSNYEYFVAQQELADGQDAKPTRDFDTADVDELRLHLQGLRIQLAEAEEGRRASELCVQALREFITKQSSAGEGILGELSLPAMPNASSAPASEVDENSRRSSSSAFKIATPSNSRWSIPRLSLNASRRNSNNPSNVDDSTDDQQAGSTRRASAASNSSSSTYLDGQKSAKLDGAEKDVPTRPAASGRSASAPLFSGSFSFSALAPAASLLDGDTSPTMSAPYTPEHESSSTFDGNHLSTEVLHTEEEAESPRRPGLSRSPESSAPSLTCSSGASESSDDESRSGSPTQSESASLQPPQCQVAGEDTVLSSLEVMETVALEGGLFAPKLPMVGLPLPDASSQVA